MRWTPHAQNHVAHRGRALNLPLLRWAQLLRLAGAARQSALKPEFGLGGKRGEEEAGRSGQWGDFFARVSFGRRDVTMYPKASERRCFGVQE
eukprot:6211066-Pleurochrysis_carterae.AAC.1